MKLRTSEKAAAGTPGSSRTRGGDEAGGEAGEGEEEEEEEEEEEAALVVAGFGADPPITGGRASGAEASRASLKKGLEAARTLR